MVGDLEAEGYFILAVLSNCGTCKIHWKSVLSATVLHVTKD